MSLRALPWTVGAMPTSLDGQTGMAVPISPLPLAPSTRLTTVATTLSW